MDPALILCQPANLEPCIELGGPVLNNPIISKATRHDIGQVRV